MPGNIKPVEFLESPLVPDEAHRAAALLSGLANAQYQVVRADKVGELGAYAFREQGGTVWLMLPLKSSATLPGISSSLAPAAFNVDQTLNVSSPPTQAEVEAIRDFAKAGFRIMRSLVEILKANQFPG